jgi:hypothetical protein
MRQLTLALTGSVVAVLALTSGSALAQRYGPTPPGSRPTYSPYLNLFRRGQPLYQNYYGLVRPQQEFERSIAGLQQQVTANRTAIGEAEEAQVNPNLRPTGHNFGYFSHQGYFLNNARGGGGTAGGAGSGFQPIARPQSGAIGGGYSSGGSGARRVPTAPVASGIRR